MKLKYAKLLLFLMQKSRDIIHREHALMQEAMDAGCVARRTMHRNRIIVHTNRIIRYNKKLQQAA